MAPPDEHTLTFLRGSGFLLSLIGAWDLIADETGQWPSQKGFILFKETKVIAVIERHHARRRGIEGTYAVQGNRLILTEIFIDTAPEQGAIGEAEFTLAGDLLTLTWGATQQIDTFRRRPQASDGALLPPVAIYESGAPDATP